MIMTYKGIPPVPIFDAIDHFDGGSSITVKRRSLNKQVGDQIMALLQKLKSA